jgi:single-stranded-DNA-specific exonuclease
MEKAKKWKLRERQSGDLFYQLLSLRGCKTEDEKKLFLNPSSPSTFVNNPTLAGFESVDYANAVGLVTKTISSNRSIFIHGDYDVDGICAAAIIWKAIYHDLAYKSCLPFIPSRFDHGYGLSRNSVDSVVELRESASSSNGDLEKPALLINVDCGITSLEEVEYAKARGFEVLILDHHVKPERLPVCNILWTEKLCAAGIAWVFSQGFKNANGVSSEIEVKDLELAALATIADIQPLTGVNRSLVKYGLQELNQTKNVGLRELIKVSGIEGRKIGTYEVGWVLAPRLNASGRLEEAVSSLRLLCTGSSSQAAEIALALNRANFERQELTKDMMELAKTEIGEAGQKINVAVHEEFHEGIIGLVAGKLVGHFGTPAVVIHKGGEFSKASARSVIGFNIVEFLRSLGDHFENVGGHAGAAGFTIRTEKIGSFLEAVRSHTDIVNLPEQVITVDAEVKFGDLTLETSGLINQLEPFGIGNPEPVFLLKGVTVVNSQNVGAQNQHLKLKISKDQTQLTNAIDCIGFGLGDRLRDVSPTNPIDLIFSFSEDSYSGYTKLVLKLKDFKKIPNITLD